MGSAIGVGTFFLGLVLAWPQIMRNSIDIGCVRFLEQYIDLHAANRYAKSSNYWSCAGATGRTV